MRRHRDHVCRQFAHATGCTAVGVVTSCETGYAVFTPDNTAVAPMCQLPCVLGGILDTADKATPGTCIGGAGYNTAADGTCASSCYYHNTFTGTYTNAYGMYISTVANRKTHRATTTIDLTIFSPDNPSYAICCERHNRKLTTVTAPGTPVSLSLCG